MAPYTLGTRRVFALSRAEWYISLISWKAYVYELFERQCEIGLQNLENIEAAVGERGMAIQFSWHGLWGVEWRLVSPETYGMLFKPFHVRVSDWVHTYARGRLGFIRAGRSGDCWMTWLKLAL